MNDLLRRLLFLPPQASTVAPSIDHLHYFVILTTMAGATAITIIGGLLLIRYRRGRVPAPLPAPTIPLWVELGIIGGLLTLFLSWWAIGFMQYLRLRVPPEDTLDVYVTAKQWMWRFTYPDGSGSIATLYVPAGRPVKVILTSRDVIHSFFVPDFRVKQDAVPGRFTTAWFTVREPGVHQILCAEFCGTSHSTMRGEVVALAPEDYTRWLAARSPTENRPGGTYREPASVDEFAHGELTSLVREGERAAARHGCLRCHTLDGSPHIGPSWAGLYRSEVRLSGDRTVLADESYLTESMMDPLAKVVAGFTPVMPTYRGLLQPAEVAAIVELVKSLQTPPRHPLAPPPVGSP
jgi:cytochrome c oxidase subunit II